MAWTKTKTTVTTTVVALALIATAVVVKLIFFPSVKDAYFMINNRSLQRVPAGLVIVRPTHFPSSPRKSSPPGIMEISVKGSQWMVGRNVTFQQLMAIAYNYNPGRIALPFNPPKGNFDFLVTVPKDPQARLQSAIRRRLGYTADVETQDTSVLALKVEDPNSPGLKPSTPGERENTDLRNGRLY